MNDWHGLYGESWKGAIVDEAFGHPAKFSRALIRHIYEHAVEEGWLQPGDTVIDPFGGVALGGLDAMRLGMHWVGVELEPKFVDLGQQNIDLWNATVGPHMRRWGSAVLLQGDSRRLCEVVREGLDGAISSPPYVGSVNQSQGANDDEARLRRKTEAGVDTSRSINVGGPNSVLNQPQCYGGAPGQLGAMEGGFDGAVSSPPYEGSEVLGGSQIEGLQGAGWAGKRSDQRGEYGTTEGQLGQEQAETFWSAARVIVEQTYAPLRTGAHAFFVVKRFVRDKEIVDFPGQWQQLCEAVGFRLVHHHKAWLVEHNGTQLDMFGGKVEKTVKWCSFFRRLYETKYPENSIDWEDVLCMVKPY